MVDALKRLYPSEITVGEAPRLSLRRGQRCHVTGLHRHILSHMPHLGIFVIFFMKQPDLRTASVRLFQTIRAIIRSGRVQEWRLRNRDGTALDVQPVARLMMDDMQAIKDTTLSGAGIAWLPLWLIREELAGGKLQEVLPSLSSGSWPVYAVWPRMPHMPPKIRLAVDELVRALPEKMALVGADI